ncbi:MAG: zinc metalloprotease HtpX [Ignavibacteria bacterium]|nr:zinc metalloprotease HtpX [Ignavibacteria bacterium]
MNTLKTTFLMALLTVLFILVGNALGGQGGMMLAFMFAIVMNFGSYFFSDKIVLMMYRAKEIQREENPKLFSMLQEMTMKANIPMPRVYIIDSEQPNAFATGRNPQHAAVAVTRGIMNTLSNEELKGVLGHELAHIIHRDILIGTIAATVAGAISMLANMAQWAMIFGGGRRDDREVGSPIGSILMLILAPIAAMLIQMAISRSREFLADEGGAQLSGNPFYLSNALRKLDAKSQLIPMNATPSTAHLFIVSPLSGAQSFMKLFSTHPPMEERIARLEAMGVR